MSAYGAVGVFRLLYILFACLCTFSFLMNFTVIFIFAILVKRGKYTLSNLVFCIQATSDLISNSLTTLFVVACSDMRAAAHSVVFSFIIRFLFDYSQYLSVAVLLMVTMERFLSFKFPFQHRTRVTTKKIIVVALVIFLLPCLPAAMFIIFNKHYDPLKVTPYFIASGIACLVMLLIVYFLLFLSYLTIQNAIYHQIGENVKKNELSRQKQQQKMNKRVVTILSSMAVIYTITLLPIIVLRSGFSVFGFHDAVTTLVTVFATLFVYLTSTLWNPLITLFFKDDYWTYMKNLIINIWKRLKHAPSLQNRREVQKESQRLEETEDSEL